MPELSRFGGMVIYLVLDDTKHHNKSNIHVYCGEYEASIAILMVNYWRVLYPKGSIKL